MSSAGDAKHTAKAVPAVPRPSASVIVVNSRNEVLMVHRNPKSSAFANVHVFPGGNYDAAQDDSLEMTAIRELFEEAGLLLASPAGTHHSNFPSDAELDDARESVHAQKRAFTDFLSHHALKPDVSSLLPFTQWVTPPTMPRRFRTQFYVAFLERAPSKGFSSGGKEERLPTPDGGQEVIAARFVHPLHALDENRAGKALLMPPQAYLLRTLADVLQGPAGSQAQRERVQTLSRGLFGRMTIHPRGLPGKDAQGRTVLTYEGDETRGGRKGRLHRCLVAFGPGGTATEIVVQRNFDIFTEIEGDLFAGESAKL